MFLLKKDFFTEKFILHYDKITTGILPNCFNRIFDIRKNNATFVVYSMQLFSSTRKR